MKTPNETDVTEQPRASLAVRFSSMVRWLAKRMDEEPTWCRAMMYLVLIYFAIRGLLFLACLPIWLALKLAI